MRKEISRLSSLRMKVQKAMEAEAEEEEEEEQDSDIDTSSSYPSNLSEPEPAHPKSPKFDSSINYSLSTTYPVGSSGLYAGSHSNKHKNGMLLSSYNAPGSGSASSSYGVDNAFHVRDINEINDLTQIQDIRDKETDANQTKQKHLQNPLKQTQKMNLKMINLVLYH